MKTIKDQKGIELKVGDILVCCSKNDKTEYIDSDWEVRILEGELCPWNLVMKGWSAGGFNDFGGQNIWRKIK